MVLPPLTIPADADGTERLKRANSRAGEVKQADHIEPYPAIAGQRVESSQGRHERRTGDRRGVDAQSKQERRKRDRRQGNLREGVATVSGSVPAAPTPSSSASILHRLLGVDIYV